MDETIRKKIHGCITFLKSQGYDVTKRGDSKVGKWVAFKKDGLTAIQHGVITHDYLSCYMVKRKNRRTDLVGLGSVVEFFDDKKECYAMR